jgi:signal transduction histidine kinase
LTRIPLPNEGTQILYGQENVVIAVLQFTSKANIKIDACVDYTRPLLAIEIEELKKAFLDAKSRGVRLRYVTEITKGNILYCKELMKIVNELRHIEGIKGNFYISETEYLAPSATHEKGKPASQTIYSNVEEIVEHQQYVFDSFWNRAISAQQRVREIEEEIVPVRTRIVENQDEIIREIKRKNNSADKLSVCTGFGGMQMSYNYLFDSYQKIVNKRKEGRGDGLRWITTIYKENLNLVKVFLQTGIEMRHIKNLPPLSFGISEKEVAITIGKMEGGNASQSFLISNEPSYLNHFNSLFEELWNDGVDAKDRIRDIEEGTESANIEIIENPKESIKLAYHLIKSAEKEVLVLLSTANTFRRQVRMGGIDILREAIAEHAVNVRILVPFDEQINQTMQEMSSSAYDQKQQKQLEIRTVDKSLETRITIIINDRKEAMIWELKDDTKDDSYEAVGVATYSNSKSVVLSYVSIFESLWKQSELYQKLNELYEHLKLHNKMQKEFINIAAHELRTPTQAILGYADLISSHPEKRDEMIQALSRNATRLQKLTTGILDVSRIESQTLKLHKEKFNINEKIKDIVDDIKKSKEDHIIKIIVAAAADQVRPIIVEADKIRIYEVISNLLSNAIKFTEKSDRDDKSNNTILISTTVKSKERNKKENNENDNEVVISIKDTGTGIDPDIRDRLFTKFATKSHTGSGLGLFISKGIIEAHGGEIWAHNNTDGKGATFAFSLPIISDR